MKITSGLEPRDTLTEHLVSTAGMKTLVQHLVSVETTHFFNVESYSLGLTLEDNGYSSLFDPV